MLDVLTPRTAMHLSVWRWLMQGECWVIHYADNTLSASSRQQQATLGHAAVDDLIAVTLLVMQY